MIENKSYKILRLLVKLFKLENLVLRRDITQKEMIRRMLYAYTGILSIICLVIFSISKILRHQFAFSAVLLSAAVIHFIIVYYSFRKYRNTHRLMVGIIWLFMGMFLFLLVQSTPKGYMAMWLFLFPPFVYMMLSRKQAALCCTVFLIAVAIILFLPNFVSWGIRFEPDFRIRFFLSLNTVAGLSFISELLRERYEKRMLEHQHELEIEKEKLAEAKKAVEAASQVKTDFLGNMSHELRTPLNHIIGFSELLFDEHTGYLNRTQREYVDDVLSSSRHLLSLIDDALNLSNAFNGKLDMKLADTNIHVLLENAVLNACKEAEKRNVRIELMVKELPDRIAADDLMLKQVFTHLLSNAVKYTQNGGSIEVAACPVNGNLDMELKKDTDYIQVSVKDDGLGIEKEDLTRIFRPFEQVESSTARKFAGTGMGLTISHQLVSIHNGHIWAESDGIGKGAKLCVVLPVVQDSSKLETQSGK